MKHMTCIEDLRQSYTPQGAEGVLRLCRPRLLCRGNAARQPRRSAARSSCASASWSMSSQRSTRDHDPGRAGGAAADPGAGRPVPACSTATAKFTPAAPRRPRAFRSRCSTMSICSIEDVAAAVDKPFWFQLYVMKDRGFISALIERAIAAKCSALVLTVDLQVIGQRHRDIKNGMTVPPEWRCRNCHRFRHQAGLGAERVARQAQDLRQSRRPHQGHGRTSPRCRNGSPSSSTPR